MCSINEGLPKLEISENKRLEDSVMIIGGKDTENDKLANKIAKTTNCQIYYVNKFCQEFIQRALGGIFNHNYMEMELVEEVLRIGNDKSMRKLLQLELLRNTDRKNLKNILNKRWLFYYNNLRDINEYYAMNTEVSNYLDRQLTSRVISIKKITSLVAPLNNMGTITVLHFLRFLQLYCVSSVDYYHFVLSFYNYAIHLLLH